MEGPLKIVLSALDNDLAAAWQKYCGSLPGVEIHRGSILELSVDAVVSPANSFGFMDGGIDHLYSRHFGWEVQDRLQELIRQRHHGELLVGAAEIVETNHDRIPFLIAAPTMRVPMILSESVNPYLAARAVFLLIRNCVFATGSLQGNPIEAAVKSVAFPGLGTGIGRVSPATCARQIRLAIEEVVLGQISFPRSWVDAQHRHQLLYTDRVRDLQQE